MPYSIEISPMATRDLKKLPRAAQEIIGRTIDSLAVNPRPDGCVKMIDRHNMWRVRTGEFRILYTIQDDRLVVVVIKIGNRREIYR
ncbi:MAG: type II toxin-antitoxin system RelE/ParE family toxin [Magnetococcales bacterium]|nr:type II toxin-antitoxin system RelE/ParE family toxin [Magnetococcales bacterium]